MTNSSIATNSPPLNVIRLALIDGIAPDPDLTVWEWSDLYRVLTSKASKEAGPWRTSRLPYAYEPMNALSISSRCTKVVVMKGAQLGFTEIGNCWLGYIIDAVRAGSILAIQSTLEFAKIFSKQRITPLIESCPRLQEKVADAKSRDSGNTILSKDFEGGMLQIAGANSPATLASMPIRFVFGDELDRWTKNTGGNQDGDGEGSPLELAEARTSTYETNKKIYLVSTPTIDGRSAIQAEYEKSSQEKYYVPCPHCSELQTLVWEQMRYDPDDIKATIAYECIECKKEIKEYNKTAMLEAGRWLSDNPKETDTRGFYINSLYSPLGWFSWSRAATKYEEARKDIEKMKVWVNTTMGLPFRDSGETPDFQRLYERREDYREGVLPFGAIMLTAGIDVQADRLECAVIAWGKNKEKWLVDYQVFMGKVEEEACWEEAEAYLNRDVSIEGSTLTTRVNAFAIDSGFSNLEVSKFAKRFSRTRCFMIKGTTTGSAFIGKARDGEVTVNNKKVKTGLRVWNIVVDMAKQELFRQLMLPMAEDNKQAAPGYFHFHRDLSLDWFRGLCSEELLQKRVNGIPKYYFSKIYKRNEPLDTVVYARAAFAIIGGDRFKESKWKQLEDDLAVSEDLIDYERDKEGEELTDMSVNPLAESILPESIKPKVSTDSSAPSKGRRRSSYW